MSLVIDLIDLVAKHKSGELRCPATALIDIWSYLPLFKPIIHIIFLYLSLNGNHGNCVIIKIDKIITSDCL